MDVFERNRLVVECLPLVKAAAKRYARRAWGCDYDDLVQIGAMAVTRRIGEYRPELAKLTTFVTLVARGAILDHLRKGAQRSRDAMSRAGEGCVCNVTVAGGQDTVDQDDAVEALLRGLDARRRDMMRAHYVDGFPMEQIGGRYGISRSRVSQILFYSIQRLKRKTPPRE